MVAVTNPPRIDHGHRMEDFVPEHRAGPARGSNAKAVASAVGHDRRQPLARASQDQRRAEGLTLSCSSRW